MLENGDFQLDLLSICRLCDYPSADSYVIHSPPHDGKDFDPGSNIVDVYVRNLRCKIGVEALETVRGSGYRLV